MKKLKYIDDSALCITRKRQGRGFRFLDENGKKITDRKILDRLRNLVIPPMWKEVMICKFDDGHIQATGRDAKGRKQYIYHSEWERQRQQEKFQKMAEFGQLLPQIRQQCLQDIKQQGWGKDKVIALIILVLDECGIRIGNQQYAKNNGTYGLTTLRRKHLYIEGKSLSFRYTGKSNKDQEVTIEDKDLIKFVKKVAQLPGYEIFRYQGEDGKMHNIDSEEVNTYISIHMGEQFSSKDFRTWTACRLAIEFYPQALEADLDTSKKKFSNILIKMVAEAMGNTPSVCRNYYVHPAVFELIDSQKIPVPNPFKDGKYDYELDASEKLLLSLIGEEKAVASN